MIILAALAAMIAAAPATPAAQTPAPLQGNVGGTVAAGTAVYDAQGAEVGKIESVSAGNAVIFTGTNRATIPLTSFGKGPKGPTLGMTRAELDAAVSKAAAVATEQLRARLVAGTDVRGSGGAVLGKVKELDGDDVVLTTGKAEVRVALGGVGVNAQGVFIGLTQAEFDAAVAANTAAP